MPKCILSGQVKSTFTQEQADGRYIQMTNGATTTLASSLQISGINNIEFTEEGEESIPASNVSYSNTTSGMTSGNVQNAIDELFQSVSEGKSLIAAAVTDKGVETAATDSFTTMAGNIGQISVGIQLPDLSNPGAAGDLRSGKQLVGADGSVVTGTLPEVIQATPTISVSSGGLITASATQSGGIVTAGTKSATQQLTTQGAKTVTPTTTNQTAVASGRYTTGAVTVKGDANLKAENIKSGVSIFGVNGQLTTNTIFTTSFSYPQTVTFTQDVQDDKQYSAILDLHSAVPTSQPYTIISSFLSFWEDENQGIYIVYTNGGSSFYINGKGTLKYGDERAVDIQTFGSSKVILSLFDMPHSSMSSLLIGKTFVVQSQSIMYAVY